MYIKIIIKGIPIIIAEKQAKNQNSLLLALPEKVQYLEKHFFIESQNVNDGEVWTSIFIYFYSDIYKTEIYEIYIINL